VYMSENPKFVPSNVKTVLTKEEKNLKERWEITYQLHGSSMLIMNTWKEAIMWGIKVVFIRVVESVRLWQHRHV
jgi:hypothetical protein